MVYVSVEDFFEKAGACCILTRQEEIECAKQMKNGDRLAREKLMQSYLLMVAKRVKRAPSHRQTLGLVLYYVQALEKAVDSFDFLQDSEPFSHRLNWWLRQAATEYIVR